MPSFVKFHSFRPYTLVGSLLFAAFSTVSARDIVIQPGDSLTKARDEAYAGDRVLLHSGTYQLTETLVLGPQNSGVTWMAAPGGTPVLSGGVPVTGWVPDKDGVWKAKLSRSEKLRQLYVNGKPAQMARLKKSPRGGTPYGAFLVKGDEPWVLSGFIQFKGTNADGISYPVSAMPDVAIPSDLEVRDSHGWMDNRLCIRAMKDEGDKRILLFEQPMGAIAQKQLWNTAFNFGGPMEIFNAREFLTDPGEFYFDRAAQTLYYMPRPGEDLAKAQVVAPVLETLVSVHGKNLKEHASGIRFEGITFAHTAWQLMQVGESHGACGTQSCALFVKYSDGNWHRDLYKNTDIPRAAVEVNSADHISLGGDTFCLAGAIGLNLENDVTDSTVEGNVFRDIGSSALNIGNPEHVYIGKQIGDNGALGRPYFTDNRGDKWDETVEGLCTNIRVANNLIRRAGIEHQPSPALNVFYGHGIAIEHNDIKYAPYDGISLGWGWSLLDDRLRTLGGSIRRGCHRIPSRTIRSASTRSAMSSRSMATAVPSTFWPSWSRSPRIASEQKYMEVSGNYIYEFGGWARNGIHPDDGTRYVYFHDNVFRDIGPDGNMAGTDHQGQPVEHKREFPGRGQLLKRADVLHRAGLHDNRARHGHSRTTSRSRTTNGPKKPAKTWRKPAWSRLTAACSLSYRRSRQENWTRPAGRSSPPLPRAGRADWRPGRSTATPALSGTRSPRPVPSRRRRISLWTWARRTRLPAFSTCPGRTATPPAT